MMIKKVVNCLLMCALSPSVVLSNVILEESFDQYPTGLFDGGNRWEVRQDAGVAVEISETSYSGKSLHINAPTDKGAITTLEGVIAESTYVDLEYYMRSDNDYQQGAYVQLIGDGGSDYTLMFGDRNPDQETAYIMILGSKGGGIESELMPYEEGKWYRVHRQLDCTTDSGFFEVWEYDLDKTTITNYASYENLGSDYTNTYVDTLFVGTSGSGGNVYVDEIIMIPEPGTLLLLALGGVALLRKRRA